MTPDLSTTYLGLRLRSPVVASASPLTGDLASLRELEREGIGAVVLPSLFEEQIEHDEVEMTKVTIDTTSTEGEVLIDLDADGTTDVNLGTPDFRFLSFRSNAVLRWEFRPGSSLFVVWQHGRSDFGTNGQFELGSGIKELFRSPANNTFLVKASYWFSL